MSTRRRRRQPSPSVEQRPLRSDFEVGYGRPPPTHQFRPGQSGNPRGRPKGSKNEALILRELLHRRIEVRERGRVRKVSVLEAILLRFAEDALKGNTKSAAFLFNRYAGVRTEEAVDSRVNDDDQKVLDAFIRRQIADHNKRKTS
jgi:hypothetical protein